MGKRAELQNRKMVVLQKVFELRKTLFASFKNSKVTKTDKEKGWKTVLRVAQLMGLAPQHKNWTFARDGLFSVWKSRTLSKADIAKDAKCKYDDVDHMILKILEDRDPLSFEDVNLPSSSTAEPRIERIIPPKKEMTPKAPKTNEIAPIDVPEAEERSLRIELLRVKIYKAKLECLALEQNLVLSPSSITKPLLEEQNDDEEDIKLF